MLTKKTATILLITILAIFVAGIIQKTNNRSNRFITIQFGRSMWAKAENCNTIDNAVSLIEIAKILKKYNFTAQGTVPPDHISNNDSERKCLWGGHVLSTSWKDLLILQDRYHWTFTSDAPNERVDSTMVSIKNAKQYTCDVINTLSARGLKDSWGLFSYPRSVINHKIQKEIVEDCFAFGRDYHEKKYKLSEIGSHNWKLKFLSVSGGYCDNSNTNNCRNNQLIFDQTYAYMPPENILKHLTVEDNEWSGVQFYLLVTGKKLTDDSTSLKGAYWDCSSSDSSKHWSSNDELYCLNDFVWIIQNIPKDVLTISSAELARMIGRDAQLKL